MSNANAQINVKDFCFDTKHLAEGKKFDIWNLWTYLAFAMNHARFMISPELNVVQETLAFGIFLKKFTVLIFS